MKGASIAEVQAHDFIVEMLQLLERLFIRKVASKINVLTYYTQQITSARRLPQFLNAKEQQD